MHPLGHRVGSGLTKWVHPAAPRAASNTQSLLPTWNTRMGLPSTMLREKAMTDMSGRPQGPYTVKKRRPAGEGQGTA